MDRKTLDKLQLTSFLDKKIILGSFKGFELLASVKLLHFLKRTKISVLFVYPDLIKAMPSISKFDLKNLIFLGSCTQDKNRYLIDSKFL